MSQFCFVFPGIISIDKAYRVNTVGPNSEFASQFKSGQPFSAENKFASAFGFSVLPGYTDGLANGWRDGGREGEKEGWTCGMAILSGNIFSYVFFSSRFFFMFCGCCLRQLCSPLFQFNLSRPSPRSEGVICQSLPSKTHIS